MTAEVVGDHRCAVDLEAPGLSVRVGEVVARIRGRMLAPFLEGLAGRLPVTTWWALGAHGNGPAARSR
ncbi:hypothetical protein [Streptomyces sp. NPDC017520]|uniref:hypothetical protein n=1 Tax=Streptomyces sp. NPDC017520 TaxID=3364998 RepID=UPI00378921CE